MSIRKSNQDHLRELAEPPRLVPKEVQDEVSALLIFYTDHPNPKKRTRVDLTEFFYGGASEHPLWAGDFKARPTLILELAPALRELWRMNSKATTATKTKNLRKWFRLLDEFDSTIVNGARLETVVSVKDLSEIHGQFANERKFDATDFSTFRSAVDLTRAAMGIRPLLWAWQGDPPQPNRTLPAHDDFAAIFHQLKRRWFAAVDRWEKADILCASTYTSTPLFDEAETVLQKNYIEYRNSIELFHGEPLLSSTQTVLNGRGHQTFSRKGYRFDVMYSGHFPDVHDARAAFHLCLQGTGWNPQTLLDLEVAIDRKGKIGLPFLKDHPTNSSRYVMKGHKTRGASDPPSIGDWKTSRAPGVVIKRIVNQTAPVRRALRRELDSLRKALQLMVSTSPEKEALEAREADLIQLIASPWLYVERRGIVAALTANSYYTSDFLREVVSEVNARREPGRKIPAVVAGDFRDAFAAFALGYSGGAVAAVRFALNHRRLRCTNPYLVNRLLSELAQQDFLKFEKFLWMEIVQDGKVDPTVLAKLVRDGSATQRERFRLKRYRKLGLSRIRVHCKNSKEPPERVDPRFKPNGKSDCVAQRCLLCYEHAAISAQSIDGICMRKAELIYLKGTMSVHAFTSDLFQEEDENADAVLSMFSPLEVASLLRKWTQRIQNGQHRVVDFNGIQGMPVH